MMRTYSELVDALSKPGVHILRDMTNGQAEALHMAVGIAGEAGEIIDCVKKNAIYQKQLDRDNLIEELGDLEFYMERLRQLIQVTRDEVLRRNQAKLEIRYGKAYSNHAAQERKDKTQ